MANTDVTKKAPIELICMMLLSESDMYGYELVQEIERRSEKLLHFSLATVYTALRRLEDNGFITARSVNVEDKRAQMRVYYHLESCAGMHMERLMADYLRTTEGVKILFRNCEEKNAKEQQA